MSDDAELLRRYAEEGANDAFAELVRRHVDLVYSAALRQLNGDAHLAADATQLVFTDLARKARLLVGHRVLAGWLFTSTRFATAKLVRTERRRQAREQEAQLMHELSRDDSAAQLDWQRVRPVLDEALGELNENDREAILLRFFEGRDYAGVGAKLHLADNAARMRVERALDKLRGLLARRGVTSTSTALAAVLANQAVAAAPAGLAATVTGAALIGSAGATGGAAAGFMIMSKLQIGMASALAVAGATGFVLQAKSQAAMNEEIAAVQNAAQPIAALRAENERLTRLAAEAAELRRDEAALASLRSEAAELKSRRRTVAAGSSTARTVAAETPPVSGPVYDLKALDQTPSPTFQARPTYPAALRSQGIRGEVVVDFVVDADGRVQQAFALRSSQSEFDAPAVLAVSQWKFTPGVKSGQSVNTHMQVPIVFTVASPSTTTGQSAKPAQPTLWF